MKLRDLQYLVAVYELQSFSKAAEQCFVSQPTLSGQLKKLEDELGVALIERTTRSILFTEAGRKVVAEARQMLTGIQRIKAVAAEHEDPLVGDFHLGVIPTIAPFLLPKIVSVLHQAFPQMTLFLHELKTDVLLERLQSGKLDAAILAKLNWDTTFDEWPLYTESLLLAAPATHALAKSKKLLQQDALEGESLLLLEDGHCLRDQALGVCFSAGAHEDDRYQATSMDTLLHMISVGHGMTLVPELAINTTLNGVTYKRFTKPQPSRDVILIGRHNGARSAGLAILSKTVQETMRHVLS